MQSRFECLEILASQSGQSCIASWATYWLPAGLHSIMGDNLGSPMTKLTAGPGISLWDKPLRPQHTQSWRESRSTGVSLVNTAAQAQNGKDIPPEPHSKAEVSSDLTGREST